MTNPAMQVLGTDIYIEGSGTETIVMIHGWPDTYRLWDAQVAVLAASYRCVRFTLPGFDVTKPATKVSFDEMMTLFRAIVDAVSPSQPVTLLLHDWGAVFGYQFAARNESRVARIVSVDIGDTFNPEFIAQRTVKAKLMTAGYQLWLASAHPLGRIGTRMTRLMAKAMKVPVDASALGAQQNYPYVMQWMGGFRGAVDFVPHCPVLYFYGKRKPFMFQSDQWLQLINQSAGSQVIGLDTGHWVMKDNPAVFNDTLSKWLKSSAVTSASAVTARS
jgi:cis-3-alkyl-4-acyloxetan-2-one decarboxylase